MSRNRNRFVPVAILAGALSLLYFYRPFLLSRFDLIEGDPGDARFLVVIAEHWFHAFEGRADFRSPGFFYPVKGTLGYSEAIFLFSLPFSLLRAAGVEMFLAFQITLILVRAPGFAAMLALLRGHFRLAAPAAIAGAALFTVSNLYVAAASHPQLSAVAILPMMALLAGAYWRARRSGRIGWARFLLCVCAVLWSLLLFTSYYVGWFAIAGGAACAAWYAILGLYTGGFAAWRKFIRTSREIALDLLLAAAAFSVALLPMLAVYLPVLRATGGRAFGNSFDLLPRLSDVYNVSESNWLWGGTIRKLYGSLAAVHEGVEFIVGWPFFTLLVFAGTTLLLALRAARRSRVRGGAGEADPLLGLPVALSAVTVWMMCWRFRGHTLWTLAWMLPGAHAIRAPGRGDLVANFGVAIVAAIGLDELFRAARRRGGSLARRGAWGAAFLCAALLLFEQWNSAPDFRISRRQQRATLAGIQRPPAACRAFYIIPGNEPPYSDAIGQMRAMMIAEETGIPTINGYSGWFPDGWRLLDPGVDYVRSAHRWARAHKIESGLCSLEMSNGAWSEVDVEDGTSYPVGSEIDFRTRGNGPLYADRGWSTAEPGGTWTDGAEARILIGPTQSLEGGAYLDVEFNAYP